MYSGVAFYALLFILVTKVWGGFALLSAIIGVAFFAKIAIDEEKREKSQSVELHKDSGVIE